MTCNCPPTSHWFRAFSLGSWAVLAPRQRGSGCGSLSVPSAKSHRPSGGKAHWMPASVQMAKRLEGRVLVVSATVMESYSTVLNWGFQ